jgi:hypothetical protein
VRQAARNRTSHAQLTASPSRSQGTKKPAKHLAKRVLGISCVGGGLSNKFHNLLCRNNLRY